MDRARLGCVLLYDRVRHIPLLDTRLHFGY